MKKRLLGLVAMSAILMGGCGRNEQNATIITVDRMEDNGCAVIEVWDAETDECQYIDITEGSCIKIKDDGSIEIITLKDRLSDIKENEWN